MDEEQPDTSDKSDIKELLRYFAKSGAPDNLLGRKVFGIMVPVSRDIRKKAIEWLIENKPKKFGLDVPSVREALRTVGAVVNEYIPAIDWPCDACGLTFKYSQVVTYEEKHDRGIFDSCPRCGFQVCDTIQARAEAAQQHGVFREWYQKRKEKFLDDWKLRKCWSFDKSKDDAFVAAQKREEIEGMKRAAAQELTDLTAKNKERTV